jgi:hypothetical protein
MAAPATICPGELKPKKLWDQAITVSQATSRKLWTRRMCGWRHVNMYKKMAATKKAVSWASNAGMPQLTQAAHGSRGGAPQLAGLAGS